MIYKKLKIEPTNICNLKCPLCPTNNAMTRKKENMSFETFKKIIDNFEDQEIKKINLWNFGEPLMNPSLFKMIDYAKKRDIQIIVSTNSTFLDKKIRKNILSSKLDAIIVCLDGFDKESHEKYRVNSNFEEIVTNIGLLVNERNKFNSQLKIRLQVLLTKENEKNIEKIKNIVKELGVDELSLKDVSLGTFTSDKNNLAKEWIPDKKDASRYKDSYLNIKRDEKCGWGNANGTILSNGDVTICCYDYNGDYKFTNVLRDNLKLFLQSDKMKEIREKISNREFDLCKKCQESNFKINIIKK
jgi:radical SAM protein with 4Fe4S-binding SPASM domain